MKDYHSYVFDTEKQIFLGKFEEMYQEESKGGFDSWHQEDNRRLSLKICNAIMVDYNYSTIIDIGCGKGAYTQFLKKKNNCVLGVDISPTALATAVARFPDIKFVCEDITSDRFSLKDLTVQHFGSEKVELIVCLEVLSYIKDWEAALAEMSKYSRYTLCSLFIPEDPIGYVPTEKAFESCFMRNFIVIENITITSNRQVILFGESRQFKEIK